MDEKGSGSADRSLPPPWSRWGQPVTVDERAEQRCYQVRQRGHPTDAFSELGSMAHRVEDRLAGLGDDACDRERAHGGVLVAEAYCMADGPAGDPQQVRNQIGERRRLHRRIASRGATSGSSVAASTMDG